MFGVCHSRSALKPSHGACCCCGSCSEHEVERGLFLYVVVREGAAVLELLAGEDEALLVGRDALLVLDL